MSERRGGRQLQEGGRSNAPGQRGGSQYPYPNTPFLVSRVSAQHRAIGRAASRGRGHGQTQIQAQPQGRGQAQPQVQLNQRSGEFPGQQTNTILTTPLSNPTTTQRVNPLTLRPPTTTPQTQRNLPAAPHTRFVTVTIHTAKCDICNRHNTSILRRCATCGWQICTPCWDARGGDGRHGTRRPFRGDVFSSPDQNQQPSEGASYDNGQRGDTPAVAAQAEVDEEVETLQAALILEGMQFARVLRPRQRRNYQEPQLAVPSPIQEETEAENENATVGDADETESEASQGPRNVVEPNTPAAPARTPSRQLRGPRSAGELGLWYLAEAASEVLERSYAEANDDIEMQDAPPTPTPRGRHTARGTRGRARPRATARLRRGDSRAARGPQGHKRQRDDHDTGGPSGAAGSAPLV
ncbi:hypothetical protein DTO271G3_7300 [Paecilomyces variotii]|nr:hypothetical protein DTO271G3_7300 [Paecilomyces variotii]